MKLADLPSREDLLAGLLRCMKGPAEDLVRMINAPARSLVTVLGAIRDKKES